MKKVLLLSYYFPPVASGRVFRTLKLAKYLPEFGWEPYIITSTPKQFYAKDDTLLEGYHSLKLFRTKGAKRNFLNDNRISKFPKSRRFYSRLSQFFHIPDNQKKWAEKAFELACELIEQEKINLIYASAPPFSTFDIALELKGKYHLPLVVDYRDSWLYAPYRSFKTPYHRLRNMKKEVEVIRYADEILTVNRRIKEHIIQDYPQVKHNDIFISSHGFDKEDFSLNITDEYKTDKFRITHCGYFLDLCEPKYFLTGLKRALEKKPEMKSQTEALFLGLLNKRDNELISKLNLNNIVLNPGYVPHRECISYMLCSDVLWLSIGKGYGEETISTYKLAEYFGARKPLLACVPDGAAKQMLKGHNAVKICEPDEPDHISEAILEYFDEWKNKKLPIPSDEFVSKYDFEELVSIIVRKFEFLIDIPAEVDVIGRSANLQINEGE